MIKNLIASCLIVFGLWSCTEEVQPTDAEIGRNFYPIKIGSYWIYNVTETKVIENVADSSLKYQVREMVTDTFRNLEKQLTYQLIRSRRSIATQDWGKDSVVLVNKSFSDIKITSNNKRVIGLVFPVREGKEWNANAFNTTEARNFSFQQVNAPFKLNAITYDTTVTVRQAEVSDVVLEDSYEVYAYNKGVIFKKQQLYEYYNTNGILDRTKVRKGIKRIYKLNSFNIGK